MYYFKATFPYKTERQKINHLLAYMDEAMQVFIETKMADKGKMNALIREVRKPRIVVTSNEETQFLDYNVRMPLLAACALEDHGKVPLERYYKMLKINGNISK